MPMLKIPPPGSATRSAPATRLPRPAPAPPAAPREASREAAVETPYERYLRTFPEGMKGDLIHGEAVIDMSTTVLHERLFSFLFRLMADYAEARGLGEVLGSRTLVKVDDENGYEPDVLFIRADRAGIVGERDVTAAVDVAVEIVSKTSGTRDRETKFEGYQRLGVPEYWLVDPIRVEAAFYRLGADGAYRAVPLVDGVFESEALPGFRLDPQIVFADPLPAVLPLLREMLDAASAADASPASAA